MKTNIQNLLVGLCIAVLAVGCGDGTVDGEGVVLDAATGEPIPGVLVSSYVKKVEGNPQFEMTTDSTGEFEGTTGPVGCIFGCPDLILTLEKGGYDDLEVKNPDGDDFFMTEK